MSSKKSNPFLISICIITSVALVSGLTYIAIRQLFSSELAEITEETATENDTPSGPPYTFDYSWADDHLYIAHAFGGILGTSYTNSYEAFLLNYELGHRVFEVDFSITEDGKTVAAHDPEHWRKSSHVYSDITQPNLDATTFTYNNFMSSLWYDKYHPIDLTKLFQIMQEYPDIYIVTDSKYFDKERVNRQFTAFRTAAEAVDPTLLDRFIIQIYNPEMLDYIMEVYPWKSVIYTLYANPDWTAENVLEFANQSGVNFITAHHTWISENIIKL